MSTSFVTPSDETSKDKRSKWRLSNPFNKDKEASIGQSGLVPNNARDSAYGGSETTSDASPAVSSQTVPTISQGQAEMQGAPVQTRTDARGRVITTTTTTVTTTTTTTEGEPIQIPPGEEVIVRKEEHAVPAQSWTNTGPKTPPIPTKSETRNKSPNGAYPVPQTQQPVEAPASPTLQNFSYPGRQSVATPNGGRRTSWDHQQQHPAYRMPQTENRPRPPIDPSYGQPPLSANSTTSHDAHLVPPPLQPGSASSSPGEHTGHQPRQSTAQSIRTAAAGIHGAGETLRGALNSSIARRIGGSSDEIAQYDAIAERGRREIETGQFVKRPTPISEASEGSIDNVGKEKRSLGLRNMLRKKSPA
ncbi:uncharacterized protein PV09_05409 [Verruconis gallopava]|uniref:Uncharacterized protein n=1 Tax=Verruconis gallopava TaxID=253628 RepID=A0A0D1YRF2_9PEZI|nr:uncharacterized protein PV09_05409 [Verruconis gallopava]KIW03182.1 hypothetical protein PV09_05409 [Verruconis gallopava]